MTRVLRLTPAAGPHGSPHVGGRRARGARAARRRCPPPPTSAPWGRAHIHDPNWALHAAVEQDHAGPGVSWPAPWRAGRRKPPTGRTDEPKPRLELARGQEDHRAPPVASDLPGGTLDAPSPSLSPSAHSDTFCRDNLPPPEDWTELVPGPDTQYPDRLDCGTALLDEHGIVPGNRDDMIVSSGHNIASPEVEEAVLTHPDVLDCAVVGQPDPARGQVVTAHVVLREG